jgi:integrase/recombinase XerD
MTENTESRSDRTLGVVIEEIREHMVRLGYKRGYRRRFDRTWRKLTEFAAQRGITSLSVDLTEAFLLQRRVGSNSAEAPIASEQQHLMRAMQCVREFQQHGCFQRRRSAASVRLPEALSRVLEAFVRFCIDDLRVCPRTVQVRRARVTTFLIFLASRAVFDVRFISIETVSGYLTSLCHLMPRTLAAVVSDLRSFLRYLVMKGEVPAALIERLPRIRVRPDARLPEVWRAEEVAALLGAIDRGSPVGKRDYAILLLAARLGMRVSDIRDLRLEDLRWEEARIERVQAKTGVPIVLPLTEEIGEALIAYLREARPTTTRREVFLRHVAPFEPFAPNDNLHHIVTTYRRRAGIELPKLSHKGLHSLRHTVATRLLEAGVALETISGVMGHLSPESTRIYTKVDLVGLRSAALDIEEVHHE